MQKNKSDLFRVEPTPLDQSIILSKELSVKLLIKRDDLFFQSGGGNKSRKIIFILQEAYNEGYNAVVTAGSLQSNHVRATALFAAKLGWKTKMIIHDEKPKGDLGGNLKLVSLIGSRIQFVNKSEVKDAMDRAMFDFKSDGYKPLYIMGGGHCVEGSYAYYLAVKELMKQMGKSKPDFIVVASGTGTTQAGIEVGSRHFFKGCKILGVSISRNSKIGKKVILQSITQLNEFLGKPIQEPKEIFFDDSFMGTGYEAIFPELLETISWAAHREGLLLDPTYTGKAFNALREYVKRGTIPIGSTVVFWHTGGLLNLITSKKI